MRLRDLLYVSAHFDFQVKIFFSCHLVSFLSIRLLIYLLIYYLFYF